MRLRSGKESKVISSWKWYWFLRSHFSDDEPLVLNIDETSVRYFYAPRKGLAVRPSTPQKRFGCSFRRRVSKAMKRRAFTHIAVVCSDKRVQVSLPQVLLIASKMLPMRTAVAARRSLGPNVELWREESGWINAAVFKTYLKRLATSLRTVATGRPWILLMDAHSVHIKDIVLRYAARLGFTVCILPASCTHAVQPLDTDGFARYKAHLRGCLQESAAIGPNSDLSFESVLAAVQSAIRNVLNTTSWALVFAKNGYLLRGRVRKALTEVCGDIPPESECRRMPTLADLQACFPRRAEIPVDALFSHLVRRRRAAAEPVAAAPGPAHEADVAEPWSARLRQRRRGRVAALASVGSSSSAVPAVPPPLPPPVLELPAASSSVLPWPTVVLPRTARLNRAPSSSFQNPPAAVPAVLTSMDVTQ